MRNPVHRQRRREVCAETGKHKYLTREDAAAGMGALARRTGTEGLSAYRCPTCGKHHVGHTPKKIMERFGLTASSWPS